MVRIYILWILNRARAVGGDSDESLTAKQEKRQGNKTKTHMRMSHFGFSLGCFCFALLIIVFNTDYYCCFYCHCHSYCLNTYMLLVSFVCFCFVLCSLFLYGIVVFVIFAFVLFCLFPLFCFLISLHCYVFILFSVSLLGDRGQMGILRGLYKNIIVITLNNPNNLNNSDE